MDGWMDGTKDPPKKQREANLKTLKLWADHGCGDPYGGQEGQIKRY